VLTDRARIAAFAAGLGFALAVPSASAELRIGMPLFWGTPQSLPVCRSQWAPGLPAYAWEVFFDVDSNVATGDQEGFEYKLYLGHFNACAFYDSSSTSAIAGLQRDLFAYEGNGVWTAVDTETPIALAIVQPTTFDFRISDTGVLQNLTPGSSVKVVAYYVPFNQLQRRQDAIAKYVIATATPNGPGTWIQFDPNSDLAGCSGCTLDGTFEQATDLGGLVVILDAIYRSGFE
jgi:hypothetical protein